MPYAGIPAGSALEAKIERCVERVMAGGETDKSSAIAICRANIKMDENEKIDTLNITASDSNTVDLGTLPGAQIQGKEMDMMAIEDSPVMGVMSFAELDAMEEAEQRSGHLSRVLEHFRMMGKNILRNMGLTPNERVGALRTLSEEMISRLDGTMERGERTVSLPTINGKLDPVYLQKLQDSDETLDLATITTNTGFKVLKALDGSSRWLGWVSNKFIDREGEILTEDAHKDYIAWLDKHPKAAPQLWTYHVPGTGRKHKADFWAYLNGFLILGGKLTEQEAKAFDNVSDDLGMSHGFYVLGKQGNLINKYRTFEATVLPRKAAANPWTEFNVKELGNMALTDSQRQMLAQLHGEDFAAALEDGTKQRAEVLQNAGIQSKANEADEKQADAVEVEEKETTEQPQFDLKAFTAGVADAVVKQLNPDGLQEAIKAVHVQGQENATAIANVVKRLEQLEATDDEKMAKELSPKIAGIDWMNGFRASQAKETIVKESEKETFEKARPNESWVTDAFSLRGGG